MTVKPGAYPWLNHHNAWRPNHIHLSLFGPTIATRLVTQMYFPGDPLLAFDPIYQSTPEGARERLISHFSLDVTEPGFALGYVFDIVLRGPAETPMETQAVSLKQTPSQTVGPFFAFALDGAAIRLSARRDRFGRTGRRVRRRASASRSSGGCSTAAACRSPTP